jgi:prepilin peptidase CpaA
MFPLLISLWLFFILALAAGFDIHTRKIPNSLIVLGLIGLIALQIYSNSVQPFSFFVGFILGISLWYFKLIGGGDSKLLIFVSAAFALSDLLWVYTLISLTGAAQALFWIWLKKTSNLPYAVAIFLGTTSFILL